MARSNRYNPNTGRRYDPNDVRFVATHEAGHAVAAIVLGHQLNSVDIKVRTLPDGRKSLGYTDSPSLITNGEVAGKGGDVVMPYLIQLFAGSYAEYKIAGHDIKANGVIGSDANDQRDAYRIAAIAFCDHVLQGGQKIIPPSEIVKHQAAIHGLLDDAFAATEKIVIEYHDAIVKVAALLIKRGSLTGDEVAALVNCQRDYLLAPDSLNRRS